MALNDMYCKILDILDKKRDTAGEEDRDRCHHETAPVNYLHKDDYCLY